MKTGDKVKCSICGKVISRRLPKGGDGSMWYPRRHDKNGEPCKGNYQEAQEIKLTPGNGE